MKLQLKKYGMLLIVVILLVTLFRITFLYDNKYTISMPLPQGGILKMNSNDLEKPLFLIDEWQICDGIVSPDTWQGATSRRTYIGEYGNYSRGDLRRSPLGSATYQMKLDYSGEASVVTLKFPELFTDYTLWLDDTLLQSGSGSAQESFLLTPGEHTITVSVTARIGYYAGMYYPGTLGHLDALEHAERIRTSFYSLAFLAPLILALFCIRLWQKTGSSLRRNFAMLCLCYSFYISYYFVQLLEMALARWWYPVEDIALYGLLFFAVALSMEAGGMMKSPLFRPVRLTAILLPILEIVLYLLTPVWPWAAAPHGALQNLYRSFICICLFLCSTRIWKEREKEKLYILGGNLTLGIGLLYNLIDSNQFEPIYTFWQFEWCGLFMVALFAASMSAQNQRILLENRHYQEHLEEMVQDRTRQLGCLLEERRAFFSDMAHDLKAPVYATNTYIEMIRRHCVGLDSELQHYIGLVEQKQQEISRRVMSLGELNSMDRLPAAPEAMEAGAVLRELCDLYSPETSVAGIHLVVLSPEEILPIFAPHDRLLLAFENIIFNALRFTPTDGTITLSAERQGDFVAFSVRDTGCGIPAEELPHLFERFYVGNAGKTTGSGLGLYIVKTIVTQAGGTVWADSVPGEGSAFFLRLPQATEEKGENPF